MSSQLKVVEAAKLCADMHYPDADTVFLGGSSAIGKRTPFSDLDLIVIDETESVPFRQSYYYESWPVEAFVLNKVAIPHFFNECMTCGIPTFIRLIVQGIVIKGDNSFVQPIKQIAREYLEHGPLPIDESELMQLRYELTEALDDVRGCGNDSEALFAVHQLFGVFCRFYMRSRRIWMGEGKWADRMLRQYDASLAERLQLAVRKFYQDGDKAPMIQLTEEIMEPYDGPFFEGFMAVSEIETSSGADQNEILNQLVQQLSEIKNGTLER